MDEKLLKKSVACIGPMGVGKSMLLTRLGKQVMDDYEFINADMLMSFIHSHYLGHYKNFEQFESDIRKIVLQTRVDPRLPNYNERLKKFNHDADEYFGTIKHFLSIMDFNKLDFFIEWMGQLQVYQGQEKGVFSDAGYNCLRTLICSIMFSTAISNIDKPIILDLGANFGSDLSATASDKENFRKMFGVNLDVDNFMSKFLNMFGTRIFFNPGESYKDNPFFKDKYNQNFVSAIKKTYKGYSTDEVDVSKLFYGFDKELFSRPRRILDIDVEVAKSKFINDAERDDIIEKIKQIIYQSSKQFT